MLTKEEMCLRVEYYLVPVGGVVEMACRPRSVQTVLAHESRFLRLRPHDPAVKPRMPCDSVPAIRSPTADLEVRYEREYEGWHFAVGEDNKGRLRYLSKITPLPVWIRVEFIGPRIDEGDEPGDEDAEGDEDAGEPGCGNG